MSLLFALKSEDPGSSINGSFTLSLMTRRLSELLLEALLLLSVKPRLMEELSTSTTIDIVRGSTCGILRLFFCVLPLCCEQAFSSISPSRLACEGRDAASLLEVSSFLGFVSLPYSCN